MIITAAVLDTNIDSNAVEIMKPKRIVAVVVPIALIIDKAIRVCKFHFSIATASKNPPRNRNTMSSP